MNWCSMTDRQTVAPLQRRQAFRRSRLVGTLGALLLLLLVSVFVLRRGPLSEICQLEHSGEITSVAFSPSGHQLVAGTKLLRRDANHWGGGQVKVWDGKTHALLTRLPQDQWVNSVEFSPDGKMLAVGVGCYNHTERPDDDFKYEPRPGFARIYNTTTFEEISSQRFDVGVSNVAFSPKGHVLAVAVGIDPCEHTGNVMLYNTQDWELTGTLTGHHQHPLVAMCFSPDGELLATGDGGQQCPDDEKDGAERIDYGGIRVWSVENAKQQKLIQLPFGPSFGAAESMSFSPKGDVLAVGTHFGSGVVDLETSQGVGKFKIRSGLTLDFSVAFSPVSDLVAASSSSYGTFDNTEIGIWSVATGKRLGLFTCSEYAPNNPLEFSPDGGHLAVGVGPTLRILRVSLD